LSTLSTTEPPTRDIVEKDALVLADDDEDTEQDLALFKDAAALAAAPVDDGYVALPEETLQGASTGPLLQKSSEIDESSACQIRHLTISPAFRKTAQVDTYILDLAVHAALGSTSSSPTRFSQVVLVLDPKLDKAIRAQALNRGFRIVGRVAAERLMRDEAGKTTASTMERLLSRIWPISFEQEVLLLHRRDWEKQKSARS
jgi:hypothetical protein